MTGSGPDLRCAIAHRGISRFRVRCGACHRAALRADPLASPRNDGAQPITTKAKRMNDMVPQKLEAGLLTITMNRPDRRNALNPDMTRGLVDAARRAAEDHEVRAVLLKGAGGTFCVGGDVKSMAEGRAPL